MYFHLCKPLFNPLHTSEGQFDQGGHPNILNRKWQGFKTDTLIQHYTNWFEWARWNITSHKPIEYLNYYCQNPNNVTEETEPRTVCQTSSLQTEGRPPVWTPVPTCAPTGLHVTPSVTGKERLQIIIYFWSQYWHIGYIHCFYLPIISHNSNWFHSVEQYECYLAVIMLHWLTSANTRNQSIGSQLSWTKRYSERSSFHSKFSHLAFIGVN